MRTVRAVSQSIIGVTFGHPAQDAPSAMMVAGREACAYGIRYVVPSQRQCSGLAALHSDRRSVALGLHADMSVGHTEGLTMSFARLARRCRAGGGMSASPVVRPTPGTPSATGGIWCCELELAEGGQLVALSEPQPSHTRVRVLVRLHGEPLGYLMENMGPAGSMVAEMRRHARHQFGPAIANHLASEGILVDTTFDPESSSDPLPPPASNCSNHLVDDDGLVSVIVCTRNRSSMLDACLDRLAQLTYSDLEIVVVDNAPSDDSTRDLVETRAEGDPRFRYVREARPGLSVARNRGLREARGTYLAYTDDDVAVDPEWIQGLFAGSAPPRTLAASLDSSALPASAPLRSLFRCAFAIMVKSLRLGDLRLG